MADIAEIGFRADTSELVEAKSRLEALSPAAGKAEKASEKMGKMLDRAGSAADKLLSAATGLGGAVDRLTAVLTAQASAAQQAAAGMTTIGTATAKVTYSLTSATTVTLNAAGANKTLATSTVEVASAAQHEATAVNQAATATSNQAGAAKTAAAANDNMAGSFRKAASDADLLKSKLAAINAVKSNDNFSFARDRGSDIAAYGAQLDSLRAKYNPLFAVIKQYKSNTMEIREANRVGAISVDEMSAALTRQRQAALTAIGAIKGNGGALDAYGKSAKNSSYATLNMVRQLSDVGVTAAMGMSPLMIAIQQGPQILDIFQQKAIETGTTVKAAMLSMGRAGLAAIAPFAAVLGVLTAVLAVVVAGFALGARSINQDNQKIVESLGLTEEQFERVKKSGVDTTVTLGATWTAFWQVLGDRLTERLAGPLKWLGDSFTKVLNTITDVATVMINSLVVGMAGALQGIVNAWRLLPAAIGDVMISGANATIKAVEWMLNKVIGGVNWLIEKADSLGANIGTIADAQLGQLDNKYAGAGIDFGKAFSNGFADGATRANTGMNKFWSDVGKRAVKNTRDAVLKAAGDPNKAPKPPKPPKSDAEKFSDIVNGAEQNVAALKAERDAIGLTAEQASRLKHETELLNEAKQKNITLTPTMRGQLMALADTMAKLDKEIADGKAFKAIKEGAADSLETLRQERDMIGLNADQVSRLKYENQLLNQARQKGIDLSPAQRAELMATAAEMANIEIETRKTNEALQLSRDLTDGFVSDMRSGLAQGQSLFKKFANAVVNALNKVLEKMLEIATQNMSGGGGGGLSGFLGGLLNAASSYFTAGSGSGLSSGITGAKSISSGVSFNTSQLNLGSLPKFAAGGAFAAQGIVNSPTAFAYAGGRSTGIMGEAGPEAVMPLRRGADGSLGVQMHNNDNSRSAGPQRVELVVRAEEGAMFRPTVEAISQDVAVNVTQDGLRQYNEALPSLVDNISKDGRKR